MKKPYPNPESISPEAVDAKASQPAKAAKAAPVSACCPVCGLEVHDPEPVMCATCGFEHTLQAGDKCPNANCTGVLA